MERWQVRKDGKPVAGGLIDIRPDDQTARQMIKAGYILYINGKRYRPGKGGSP